MKQRILFKYLISSLSADMILHRLEMPQFIVQHEPREIWKQKVFCILSSQFDARRAATICDDMLREVPFFDTPLSIDRIEKACSDFLRRPQVGYRFPQSRAEQISQSWFSFAQIMHEYQEYVRSFPTEHQARNSIIECSPGIGLKQASMFLRNIGASKKLSVIDVHVLFYLRTCHGWYADQLTPKRYLEAEDIIRHDAELHGLELNVFDTIVWAAARALKKASHHV
jgi:N-glycosylase/DNA lyase